MRNYFIILFVMLSIAGFSQKVNEKEITTEVEKVTVFFDGAQITRIKSIDLPVGTTLLKFKGLSPFVDTKSVQVSAQGAFTILSVNHQVDYKKASELPEEVQKLQEKMNSLITQIDQLNISNSTINDQLEFLNLNREVGSENQAVSVPALNMLLKNYSDKVSELKLQKYQQEQKIVEIEEDITSLKDQIAQLSSTEEYSNTEIWVSVECKQATNGKFTLNYLVNNAGWFPTYDIIADKIDQPLKVVYKANLRQDTKINWDKVRLSFSSNAPNNTSIAPKLETYFLDYYRNPPKYNTEVNTVSGYIMDINMEPLPGATVMIKKTSIGAVADMNGFYSITIPPGNDKELTYSFIGYESQTKSIHDGPTINVQLEEEALALEEVVTTGYGTNNSTLAGALQGKLASNYVTRDQSSSAKSSKRKQESLAIPFEQVENATSMNFEIQKPYTVKSDNKNLTVEMTTYEIPAVFQYYSVPKIIPQVFLKAYITNWEAYNFLEAEANIYVEGTYLGKSLIDPRLASDTLEVSLGADKNISIERKKVKDMTNRQFLGTKKEETIAWKTIVKNNKSFPVQVLVLDQVPVSKKEEIEIDVQNKSNGNLEDETGEISWDINVKPAETKELLLKYEVKYPKSRSLNIE